jgi:site-specific DNA-methyltransferase (adenine-specific)
LAIAGSYAIRFRSRFSGGRHKRGDGRADWGAIIADDQPFDPAPWIGFRECVLWGANHYAQALPRGTTLTWIKKAPHLFGTFLSDAEMGWMKGGYGVYVYYEQFPPTSRMAENDGKVAHPTQKPIGLMAWCIGKTKAAVVADPYMGSASTAIACTKLGRKFIGIELDPTHFATACRRIEAAYRQPDMFIAPPAKPVQEGMAL